MTVTTAVRVRIAPSPTGNLHIGTARAALFNYLFAHHHQGVMVLRIEDTDGARSQNVYVTDILNSLQLLGLHWDEGPQVGGDYGPYFQSERMSLYQQALQQLLTSQQVYPCFCSATELAAERSRVEAAGQTYVYSQKCRQLSERDVQQRLASGEPCVFRLKVEPRQLCFADQIRGDIAFDTALIGDIIVARGDQTPMYNFAVVVDDVHMQITHVIRGEDHISNTPKQILIYEALGASPPIFAHAAMILAPDRSKLSKRHGATSVTEYIRQGFLPEAMVNYLALLGWSPSDGQEVLTLAQMVDDFSLARVNKSGAVFDIEKLKWLNGVWLRRLSVTELWQRWQPFWQAAGYAVAQQPEDWWLAATALFQEKMTLLVDGVQEAAFLLSEDLEYPDNTHPVLAAASAAQVLADFREQLLAVTEWQVDRLKQVLESTKQRLPLKAKEIMLPIRIALTAKTSGPDLMQTICLLGQKKSCQRLSQALSLREGLAQNHG